MALIPPFFLDTVVAIGTLNDKNETIWIGTGFLYGQLITPVEGEKLYRVYLVTNKHVLQGLHIIILRFNPHTDQAATDFTEGIIDKDGKNTWTGHPDPNIDVAVLSINPEFLSAKGLKFGFFQSDEHTLTTAQMKESEVTEGDFIYILGFPMRLIAKDRQHVIVRQGVIARIRDYFESRSKDFIVDAYVFPGNSGGPVVMKPEIVNHITGTKPITHSNLIGVIKSYIPYQDIAVSQQTNRPRVIFEENSGLSLVEPVDHIIQTIEEDLKSKNIT